MLMLQREICPGHSIVTNENEKIYEQGVFNKVLIRLFNV